ncbi:MAG: hypothetical protein Q9160_003583 [Pyrenula sp. 1 TL-2023]
MRSFTSLACLWLLGPSVSYAGVLRPREGPPSADLRAVFTGSDAKWSSGTVVSFANSSEFVDATIRRELFAAPSFAAAVTPDNEDDVAQAVKLAVQNNIPFIATGGRHGSGLGYAKMQGGIAIDLSKFKSFEADSDAATATIGGAATVGEFKDKLAAAGLMLPSGSCSCPGYAGLAVGGGIGRYMGSLGLVTDRLVSARVVTAKGDIVNVSADENSDLFWGLRGAGANFGIILSATYSAGKSSDMANGMALTVDMIFSVDKVPAYFQHLESVTDTLPGNVGGIHLTMYNTTTNAAELFVNWVWFGPEEEGRAFISQWTDLEPYSVSNFEYVPWNKVIAIAAQGVGQGALCTPNTYDNTYASNMKLYSASSFQTTFDALANFYQTYPAGRLSSSNLEIFPNQAVAALPDDFSAYPWRDTKGFFTISAVFDSADLLNQTLVDAGDRLAKGQRDQWSRNLGYAEQGGTIYVNYAHGDEPIENIWGAQLPKLATLKKQWDPSNVFGFNNPLPTRYP